MSRQGRHGEANFARLCQDPSAFVDAVVNKASDDEHGWDHVVDLTPQNDELLPADLQDHLVQCFAQIKTTRGKYAKTRVKLSNAIKASKSPNPSFIFLFHHSDSEDSPTLYGKHIWKDDIEKFLMRARDVSVNDKNKPLYKIYMPISFTDKDIISEHPSDWMLAEVRRYGIDRYPTNKMSMVKSIGYEDFPKLGEFSIPATVSMSDIVMHEIGLSEDLPVVNFSIFDNRFGIKVKLPEPNIPEGRISFVRDGKPLNLKLTSIDGASFDMPASLHVPMLVPYGHDDYKYRVKAGCLDIIVTPAANEQTISFSLDLSECGLFCHKVGVICFLVWSDNSSLEFEVQGDEGSLLRGQTGIISEASKWMDQHVTVGLHLADIIGPEKMKNIKLSHQDFHNNVVDMHFAAAAVSAGSFRFDAEFDDIVDEFKYILGYSCTSLDGWSVGAFYEFELKAQSENNKKHTFYFGAPRVSKKFSFKQPIDKFREFLKEEFDSFRKSFNVPTAVIMDGDLASWARSSGDNGAFSIDVE